MKEVLESLSKHMKDNARLSGTFAGDGNGFWCKCDNTQAAVDTKLRYVVCAKGQEPGAFTILQA